MGTGKTSATTILRRIKEAEDYQKIDGWYDNYKRLVSYLQGDFGNQMYQTKYVVNTIYNLVNLIIPNLYFQNPFISVRPKKQYYITPKGLKIDGFKRSQLVEQVLNNEIKEIGFKNEVRKCIQDVLLGGIGVMKLGRSGSSICDDDIEYIDDGDIFAKRISPLDYLPDPMATSPSNCRFEAYRYVEPLESVKSNKMFKNTQDLEGSSISEQSPKKEKKDKSKDSDKWVELYEYHDHVDNKIYVVTKDSGKKRILMEKDKPYEFKGSDFVVLRFTGDNDTFKGVAPLMMVEDEALALNEVLSLTINHLQKFAGVILYEEGALDEDDIERFEYGVQGDMLQTQNGALREGRIRRETPLSMGMDYYNNFNLLTSSIDRTLAIPDFQRSSQSGKRKTALEVNVAASDANNRRGYYVSFVKDFVISCSEKITSLMQQFYDEKRWIMMNGEYHEWVEWTNEDIKGEYSFDFDVEDIKAYSSAKAQAIIQAIQIMSPLQIFAPVWQKIDPFKLANMIFKNMDLNLKSVQKGEELAHYEHDPYKENELVLSGKRIIDPFPGEPHEDHSGIHQQGLSQAQSENNENAIMEFTRHMQMHDYWKAISGQIPGQIQPQTPINTQSPAEAEGGFTYNQDLKQML